MAVHTLRRKESRPAYHLVLTGVLVLPFVVDPVIDLARFAPYTLVCLPATLFGLWGVHRMQRFRRMPIWLLGAAFLGGPLIGTGFGASMNVLCVDYTQAYLIWPRVAGMLAHPDLGRLRDGSYQNELLAAKHTVNTLLALNAGVFEELGKGIVVGVLYLLLRRHWDGLVSGLVLGMAVGLGFNLLESVEYMNGDAVYQFWLRQTVGLMGAHTAFTAIVGAGFGLASQFPDRRRRLLAIGGGFLTAMCAHFANDAILFTVSGYKPQLNAVVDAIVLQPLILLLLQGPFVLMYTLLLRRGLRAQAAVLRATFEAEVAADSGVVTRAEIPMLLNPRRRLVLRVRDWRRHGFDGVLRTHHLHRSQLDLGMRLSRGEIGPQIAALRAVILGLKTANWLAVPSRV
jgi:RsiW-degrading membrane proteinase PrsW (M82 family)